KPVETFATQPDRNPATRPCPPVQFRSERTSPPASPITALRAGAREAGRAAAPAIPQSVVASAAAAEGDAARASRLVREAADTGSPNLAALAAAAADAHPLNIEIQFLHAVALLGERRFEAACATARR